MVGSGFETETGGRGGGRGFDIRIMSRSILSTTGSGSEINSGSGSGSSTALGFICGSGGSSSLFARIAEMDIVGFLRAEEGADWNMSAFAYSSKKFTYRL